MDETRAKFTAEAFEALLTRVEALERENALLRPENATLKAENERLKLDLAAARKSSRNSSKPPSSDIVKPKPPPPEGQDKRRIGGQPGHEAHFRQLFTLEQLDETHVFDPASMTCSCGGVLEPCPAEDQVRQQIDLPEQPLIRREFRARAYRCPACGKVRRGMLPRPVRREGFLGDRLTAALTFLNAKAHASHTALAAFMGDVCDQPVSRGQIAKALRRTSDALEAPYTEALARLREEPVLNIDETGHREGGKRFWTWVFRANDFTVFHIDKTRGSSALTSVLGSEYAGTIGCDCFSAYHKYAKDVGVQTQLCHAHLIRDMRFLEEHPDSKAKPYAERALDAERHMFETHRRLRANPGLDRLELVEAGEKLRRAMVDAPPLPKAQNLAKRFQSHGDAYLRFIAHPEIEPTNNRAEQAIRQVVIDRASSQGTRSPLGRVYKERVWTVLSTCAQRGRSAFNFILDALTARTRQSTAPPLLPS
jgi:transposase